MMQKNPDSLFEVRLATMMDAELLYNLRNQNDVLLVSFDSQKIDLAGHMMWLESFLKNEKNRIFLFNVDQNTIGYFRVNENKKVSVAIDLKESGKSYGSKIIKIGSDLYCSEFGSGLIAEIKSDNLRSISSFKKAGYVFDTVAKAKSGSYKVYKYKT